MKRCKSLRNEAVVNEDRISQLPEALLLHILSSLPTKDVVATSVLSKQWKFLWKLVPKLEFIYNALDDLERFSYNVSRCLLSHQAPVLQSLHLDVNFNNNLNMDIGILIGIAFGLRVRELELQVHDSGESFRFPTSLYNCETLETLKLSLCIVLDVPFPVCFKSLRTLHLYAVEYQGDESVRNLLSGCCSLEELVVDRFKQSDVNTFTIAVPSLQRLTITADNEDEEYSSYVINAPCLKYLKIGGIQDAEPRLIENTPELEEANLSLVGKAFENILGSLGSVKRLSLQIASHLEIKFPTGSFFYQLVYLELHTYDPEWWNLLTLMLDNSPKLQVLKLISESFRKGDRDRVAYRKWRRPKYVPECLLLHLETLVWKNYQGRIKDEKQVAKYILRHAKHLKKATFSKTFIRPEKRLEMLEELESVVRASNTCQLVFKETDITCESCKLHSVSDV